MENFSHGYNDTNNYRVNFVNVTIIMYEKKKKKKNTDEYIRRNHFSLVQKFITNSNAINRDIRFDYFILESSPLFIYANSFNSYVKQALSMITTIIRYLRPWESFIVISFPDGWIYRR